MKSITFNLPEEVDEKDFRMAVAAILFDKAIFSSGQAAEFVNITKKEFLETVGKFGVSIFGETKDDLES